MYSGLEYRIHLTAIEPEALAQLVVTSRSPAFPTASKYTRFLGASAAGVVGERSCTLLVTLRASVSSLPELFSHSFTKPRSNRELTRASDVHSHFDSQSLYGAEQRCLSLMGSY